MTTRELIPWTKLTRGGTPEMQVSRLPLLVNGVTLSVGSKVTEHISNRSRLRQLYEQRRIESVNAPAGSIRAMNEATRRSMGERGQNQPTLTASVPAAPVNSGAEFLPPSVAVPVAVVNDPAPSGYAPRKGRK